jgi:hypothetical protein
VSLIQALTRLPIQNNIMPKLVLFIRRASTYLPVPLPCVLRARLPTQLAYPPPRDRGLRCPVRAIQLTRWIKMGGNSYGRMLIIVAQSTWRCCITRIKPWPKISVCHLYASKLCCNGLGHAQPLVPGGIAHVRLPIYAARPTADSQSSACPLLTHPLVTPLHM